MWTIPCGPLTVVHAHATLEPVDTDALVLCIPIAHTKTVVHLNRFAQILFVDGHIHLQQVAMHT